jgi:hypothetical protein
MIGMAAKHMINFENKFSVTEVSLIIDCVDGLFFLSQTFAHLKIKNLHRGG